MTDREISDRCFACCAPLAPIAEGNIYLCPGCGAAACIAHTASGPRIERASDDTLARVNSVPAVIAFRRRLAAAQRAKRDAR